MAASPVPAKVKDHVQYYRVADTPGLVLGEARFSQFRFDRHYHLDYHIGLVTDGIQRQSFQGKTVLLGPGRISLMPPGEVHDGIGEGGDAYTLKTFRLSPDLLCGVTKELSGSYREPMPAGAMIENQRLAERLLRLHSAMQRDASMVQLLVQSELLLILEQLFAQTRVIVRQSMEGAFSPTHWQRVKDYCHMHLTEKITLAYCPIWRTN